MKYPGIVYTKVEENVLNISESIVEDYNARSYNKFVEYVLDNENLEGTIALANVSHLITNLGLDEDGNLEISFSFLNTPHGFQLMKSFNDVDYSFKPVIVCVGGEAKEISRFILTPRRI